MESSLQAGEKNLSSFEVPGKIKKLPEEPIGILLGCGTENFLRACVSVVVSWHGILDAFGTWFVGLLPFLVLLPLSLTSSSSLDVELCDRSSSSSALITSCKMSAVTPILSPMESSMFLSKRVFMSKLLPCLAAFLCTAFCSSMSVLFSF